MKIEERRGGSATLRGEEKLGELRSVSMKN
jgi:hypothetical protein